MGYVQMVLQKKNPFLTHEEQDAATMLTDIHSVASIRENEIRLVGKKSIIIPALNFYGVYTSSPNNRFRIAWCDGLGRGNGLYVLIKGDDIICQGSMARAHDGKVADNGTFILSDWCSSEILTGVFYAFNENGVELLRVNYAANLFSNGISEDGRFAACQTCSSNDEKDSAVLSIFDLVNGKELCRFRAKSGWPTTIEFSANGEFVVLGHQNNARKLKYMLDGKFFDRNF